LGFFYSLSPHRGSRRRFAVTPQAPDSRTGLRDALARPRLAASTSTAKRGLRSWRIESAHALPFARCASPAYLRARFAALLTNFPPRAFTYTCIHFSHVFIYDLIRQTTVPSACIRIPYTPGGQPDIETARLKPDIDTHARSTWCSNGPARETYTVTCIHCCSARIGAIPGHSRVVKPSEVSSRGP
jgi:hypothetical protein